MKKFLKISNSGNIDSKAFELIGASTKRDDPSTIGQFGSGLKYSIAWLLRNGIEFRVFSGTEEILFGKKVEEFRGKVFERILINDRETSYTTDMGGIDWQTWMIIREIWCNALDEGQEELSQINEDEVLGHEGRTTFFIEMMPRIEQVVEDWDMYFSSQRRDLLYTDDSGIKIYSGGNDLVIYRKGVRCSFEKDCPCVFHYDIPNLPINEARQLTSDWDLRFALSKFWVTKVGDKDLIKRLVKNFRGKYEFNLNWELYGYTLNKLWDEALENKYIVEESQAGRFEGLIDKNPVIQMPEDLVKTITRKIGESKHIAGGEGLNGIQKVKPNEKQNYMLNKAEEFCRECQYDIKYPIHICRFSKKGILGQFLDGKIYISEEAFDSLSFLVSILIEENEHGNSGFSDETRAFQNHLIGLFLKEKLDRFTYVI